jgi:hypothetical protein
MRLLHALFAGGKVKAGPKGYSEKRRKSKVDEARDILAHVVLCHVPVNRYNFQQKVSCVVHNGTRAAALRLLGLTWVGSMGEAAGMLLLFS